MPDTVSKAIPVMIERPAKLFEAGEYPDKDLEVTEADLDIIVGNFVDGKVPVRISHTATPFDGAIGMLKRVWRAGSTLFGTLAFPQVAWDFIEHAGARKISVSMPKTKDRVVEVSLVGSPRVPDAAIFDAATCFELDGELDVEPSAPTVEETPAEVEPEQPTTEPQEPTAEPVAEQTPAEPIPATEVAEMPETTEKTLTMDAPNPTGAPKDLTIMSEENATLKREKSALEIQVRDAKAAAIVDQLKRSGKIVPAAETFARALLVHGSDVVEFADKDGQPHKQSISDTFLQFLLAQPRVVAFAEEAEVTTLDPTEFTAEEIASAAKLNITVEDLRKYANR